VKLRPTPLAGAFLIEPQVHGDARGFFMESWNRRALEGAGIHAEFTQDNHSRSGRGVLRGMHFQAGEHAQGKLKRVVRGTVFDAFVDLRRSSPTFGRWHGEILSEENHRQLWVPPGFAHGFLVLSESADFLYKCTGRWRPDAERTLAWNDPEVGIEWPIGGHEPILSDKDRSSARTLREGETFP